jgi:serine/threonine protein kinase
MGNKNIKTISNESDSRKSTKETKYEPVIKHIGDYTQIKSIGKGYYSKVNLVRFEDQTFALKFLNKLKRTEKQAVEYFNNEKTILEKVDQKYIIKLLSSFNLNNNLYLVFHYYEFGDLFYYIRHKKLTEQFVKIILTQLYLAIEYLHERNIIYRDLKPENIIIDMNGNIKLLDFGLALEGVNEECHAKHLCGTNEYIPPEVIRGESYSFNFDWWGYGILMYELLFGKVLLF